MSPQTLLRRKGGTMLDCMTQEPMSQFQWYEGMVQPFEVWATEVAHPSILAKNDQLPMWMGSYLKPGKSSHTKGMHFKPEGVWSIFYPTRVNANLVEISDDPLKERHMIFVTDKDTEVAETFARESSVTFYG